MPHELPPLPYSYEALEPHIDAQTVRLHHDMHHKSYVDGLNNAEAKLEEARQKGDFALIKHWSREAAFHGSGHILHTIFWENMKPNGGGEPSGVLAEAIKRDFGSFEIFKDQLLAAANAVEGSGWALLVCQGGKDKKLAILQTEKHQNLTQWGVTPLLALDVWEHAYYLKYQNRRAEFTKAFMNLVNWDDVAKRYAECC
ncbi:MAG: superoxide dismutase [Calditrichaeota bacterium]|nr:superoxide dismutase [Calditrichota bacterium]